MANRTYGMDRESVLYKYNRKSNYNDQDFGYDFLIFNKDFTGTYINSVSTYHTTWNWTDSTKTSLKFLIHDYDDTKSSPNSLFAITWLNISVTGTTLRYTETYAKDNGDVVMAAGERTPAPPTP